MSTIKELHDLYIADLGKVVCYGGKPQTRLRAIGPWKVLLKEYEGRDQDQFLPLPPKDPTRNIWMWADPHFSHHNILNFGDRPYPNIELMNECLIQNHNNYVKENDISIWVGDVSWGGVQKANELLDRCNGYKILVIGNHDFNHGKLRNYNFDEVHMLMSIPLWGTEFILTHYPMENLPNEGYHNIYGHVHQMELNLPNSTCVSVEQRHLGYRPIRLFDVYKFINQEKED